MISATKSVAASTTALLIACNVKAEWRSKANERLQVGRGLAKSQCSGSTTPSCFLLTFIQVAYHGFSILSCSCTHACTSLQDAGSLVKKATDHLVQSAQKVKDKKEEEAITVGPGGVPGIKGGAQAGSGLYQKTRNEWLARADVYKIEKELAEARKKLDRIRKGT